MISVVLVIFLANAICLGQPGSRGQGMVQTRIDTDVTEHFVDVAGRKLHAKVYGEGGPTVVLISGFGGGQWVWHPIIPALAELTTVVTYDRPGNGQSELGDKPCHALQAADDLNELLGKLEAPKPYVIVGHSFGCRVARLYAANYPDDVGALLFEDGQHPRILQAQLEALTGSDRAILESMATGLNPPENPRFEMDFVQTSLQQALECGPMPQVPFVVLTSGDRAKLAPPMFTPEGKQTMIELGLALQKELVALIPGGKHIVVEDAGHIIHNDKPQTVIAEIVALIKQVRNDL